MAMPDWTLAIRLLERNQAIEHKVSGVKPGGRETKELGKHKDILEFLKEPVGQALTKKFTEGMDNLQGQIRGQGVRVVELPGMFFEIDQGGKGFKQRAFPRNIANSQPTKLGILIVSEPPEQELRGVKGESVFLTEWKDILSGKPNLIKVKPENMLPAWQKGGEAHCVGNAIREPFKK